MVAIVGGGAALSWAGFDEGVAAYDRGDYAIAYREWLPLAEQGDTRAQNRLGFMYRNGQGAPENYDEAIKWFRKAAEQGDAEGQSSLGFMYRNGQGAPENYDEAAKWFHRAAAQGDESAMAELGVMYEHELGVPQDYVQAHKWYNLAASRTPAGQNERYSRARRRENVAKRMTPAQIARAQQLASEWYPRKEEPSLLSPPTATPR